MTAENNCRLGAYKAIDPVKSAAVADEKSQPEIKSAETTGQFSALGKLAMFPLFTLARCLALIAHFKSRDGHQPVQLEMSRDKSDASAYGVGEIAEIGKHRTFNAQLPTSCRQPACRRFSPNGECSFAFDVGC